MGRKWGVNFFLSHPLPQNLTEGFAQIFACDLESMRAKNPENFSKIVSKLFEIFRDLHVIPIQVYGSIQNYYIGVFLMLLDTPSHSAWSESSRSYSVATGQRPERSDRARDTGVRSDSERETDHAYPGNRRYKYVCRHGNRFAMYDFLFDFNRHYKTILNRLARNKLLPVYTSVFDKLN